MKKFISVLLALSVLILAVVPSFAAETDASLKAIYGDNMLFKQNEDAVIAGTGNPGSTVSAELFNSGNQSVASGTATVNADGSFEVSFTAPSGSFEEYTIILKQNGVEFRKLSNVVFGELWLASGQSNMQYPLGQARHGIEMMEKSEKLSRNLRVLITPFFDENNGKTGVIPSEPQTDIPGSEWITGEDSGIYGMSAVAYFFAAKMIEELGMPVGILNISLGGSTIASWISRKSVEANAEVKNDMIRSGTYVDLSEWDTTARNIYADVSANYNYRIEAVKHFRLSGMIWYQGESDIVYGSDGAAYSRALDLLQRSYTELFKHQNGLLPIVFTQLASYFYSGEGWELPSRNVDFSEIQQEQPDSRALISIYDVPLTYTPVAGLIHPESKLEVGERMAFAALGLVYDRYDSYTTATVDKSEIKDGAIYVTFKNFGDALIGKGEPLKGFSICGNNGIYVKADAEIISTDTVKICNKNISEPCSAAYAYSVNNEKANLFASFNGKPTLPVSPFVTDRSIDAEYWSEKTWADCDDEKIWHTIDDAHSGFYSSWNTENAGIFYDSSDKTDGTSSLKITSSSDEFSISPVFTYENGTDTQTFYDADTDYSKYGKIEFSIKNAGTKDVKIENIKFSKNRFVWYSPAAVDTSDDSLVIPADGEWHSVAFDLNKVYLFGFECGISYPSKVLYDIKNITFCFGSEDAETVIHVDEIRFAPTNKDAKIGFDADFNAADNIFEYISCAFVRLIGTIASIF